MVGRKVDQVSASTTHNHRSWSAKMIDPLRASSHHDSSDTNSLRKHETELKGAHEAVKGSFVALESYVTGEGVKPRGCVYLLSWSTLWHRPAHRPAKLYPFFLAYSRHSCFSHSSSLIEIKRKVRRLQYVEAMVECQDLMRTLPVVCSSQTSELLQLRIIVLLNSWQALCRYTSIRHRRAQKIVFQLRHEHAAPAKAVRTALALQLDMAEQCTASQKGIYLTQQWQKRCESHIRRRSKSDTTDRTVRQCATITA